MKFCKKYQEYMQGQENQMPGVGFKKLKKILNKCRRDVQSKKHLHGHGAFLDLQSCPRHCPASLLFQRKIIDCPVCDGTFFPSLLKEMSDAAKLQGSHIALIQEGKDLVNYAMINAIAIRKILKMIRFITPNKGKPSGHKHKACTLKSFNHHGYDTVFDPVSLTCGHIFCSICASSAASVTIVDGLRAANPKEKCPLCREAGVYEGAVHLDELSILLRRRYDPMVAPWVLLLIQSVSTNSYWDHAFIFLNSCREYWEQRLKKERVERVRQAKQHWESQCQAFIGL
ncbi:hypothetical protein GOBAR_AA20627 [Gossypium barbadense]|uniref:RING-type domain-containing protein n=1 Tax=Gossypium barbadense TaxID=3634 RepID=A0A2P5X9M5_GOSBA|nr:hypothetical protein GOBAR_AA20627 [Gossypium barbadense]